MWNYSVMEFVSDVRGLSDSFIDMPLCLLFRIPSQIMQQMDQLYVLHCNWSLWLSLSYWCPRDLWGVCAFPRLDNI